MNIHTITMIMNKTAILTNLKEKLLLDELLAVLLL